MNTQKNISIGGEIEITETSASVSGVKITSDTEIKIDISQVGATPKIWLIGTRT